MSPRRPELADDVTALLGGPDAATVVVAVSGGSDSVAMLLLMHEAHLAGRLPTLHVAHLNHHVRPGDAEGDAEFVRRLAERLALPVTSGDADVPAVARQRRIAIEQAARDCRYAFLEKTALAVGARWIAVGHTADDQVETVLFNVRRGAGIHGLAGMPRSRPISRTSEIGIVRPVIDCTRTQLLDDLERAHEGYRTDHTNLDVTYTRNRIRHTLVPLLEASWPDIRADIADFTRVLGELDDLLGEHASAWIERCASEQGGATAVSLDALNGLREPVLSTVIRGLIARTLGDLRRIDEVHVRMIIDLAAAGTTGASLDLPRGLVVRRERDTLHVRIASPRPAGATTAPGAAARRDAPDFSDVELPVPGSARWGEWTFETTLLEGRHIYEDLKTLGGNLSRTTGDDEPEDASERMRIFIEQLREIDPGAVEYLDYDRLGGETLTVRQRRPGDRFTPLGSPGERKLKDYLISRHIPRAQRDFVPLIVTGGRIRVVVGFGLDDGAALSENTRRILKITAIPRNRREGT